MSGDERKLVLVTGLSGGGKSTALRMIAGLEEISGGEISIGDRVVNELLFAEARKLGAARLLKQREDELPGVVKLIFQPAEEGAPPGEEGGAHLMLEEGVFDNPKPVAALSAGQNHQ